MRTFSAASNIFWIVTILQLAGPAMAQASKVKAVPTPVMEQTVDEHMEYWIRTLKTHPLKLVRKNAARSLGRMADRQAVEPLVGALKDPYQGVRAEAARALGMLGDERAFASLHETISSPNDRETKKAASEAIEKIKARQEYQKEKELKEQAKAAATPK